MSHQLILSPVTATLATVMSLSMGHLSPGPGSMALAEPTAPLPAATSTAVGPVLPEAAAPAQASPGSPVEGQDQPAPAAITRKIVLELGRRTISLLEDDEVKGSWPVAIGDPKTPTPVGTYKIRNKIVNPQYESTNSGKVNPTIGPNGPLGDRWIGFHSLGRDQFGIHGTPTAWSWTVTGRTAVTNGCVRMLTPHVRQLFDKVEVGTPVLVKH